MDDTEMLGTVPMSTSSSLCSYMRLDMETQPFDFAATQTVDSIHSFKQDEEPTTKKAVTKKSDEEVIECECGVTIEDFVVFCEAGCERWYHLWSVYQSDPW